MRVLIYTSSGGTAHDAAAEAIAQWLALRSPQIEVRVEQVLERSSPTYRRGVALYNWIQRHHPWLHQLYWRAMEWEDLVKPGTVLFGRKYLIRQLREFRPDVLISTHPHTNRGHFALAKRVLGPQLRCITCCTELDGGFGFSRNWLCRRTDLFWALTDAVAAEVERRRPGVRAVAMGPLLYPAFHQGSAANHQGAGPKAGAPEQGLPLLVLATGSNGANNHLQLLDRLLPFAGQLEVAVLCGRRPAVFQQVEAWAALHPDLDVRALNYQGPAAMADLYGRAWAMVSRPGARTATEALMMACPLIFNHYGTTMPQELLAPRYFAARGLGHSIYRPGQLAALVAQWLGNPDVYAALCQRYQDHRLRSDPERIVNALLSGTRMA
jgi:UDP-N-acetylglucosamine:LPS N-acetylglucosamine transferase